MEKTLEIDERVRELTEDEMAHVSGGSAGGARPQWNQCPLVRHRAGAL